MFSNLNRKNQTKSHISLETETSYWTQLSSAGFTPRSQQTAVLVSNAIYVYGGIDSGSTCLNDIWKYTVSTGL